MHSTTGQTSSTVSSSSNSASSSSSSKTTTNIEQYHYPPISTLRRPSRPSNIDLSVFDVNNSQQSNDPGIYSAPICHLKQTHNTNQHHPHHIQQSSLILSPHPHTATFHYQPPPLQQQHIQLSSHHHQQQQQQQHSIHQYQQQAHHHQQQQQQHILDPFSQHQHTPHTFPLQTSSNHYQHYFHFPPSTQNLGTTNNSTPPAYNQLTLQANVTSNGHHSPLNHRSNPVSSSTTNTSQPPTPTHNNRLLAVQIQEQQQQQQQQQWSNPVLSPFMVKRMNEGGNVVTSMNIDDDEDPSASIDALVADVDSNSQDLLDDQQHKSVDENKTTSTTSLNESRASTTSPSPHLYLRSTSHILTTPPNPLASNDHPDNQLTVGNNFQKTFSPIHSAGFEIPTNHNVQISSSSTTTTRTSFFTFDTNVLKENDLKSHLNDENKEDNQDPMTKPLIINTDERLNIMSTNGLNQDDNSNHSSTNSNSQNTSSRTLSQILKSSGEKNRLSSSSTDMKGSPLSSTNNKSQTTISSMSPPQQTNRHYCTHPECTKIFANKSALAKHKLTHCQDRKHKCSKCNKGFKRLDHLHGHMLTHEEEKPHKCRVPDCNRTYCDARSLKRHIENAHQNILAAIHQGGHDEYRSFLPETAFVKTKEFSSDFSIDSIDHNSPRSSYIDNEQTFHMNQQIRSTIGQKIIPTYTFDEEKCIECQICKKSFKNGAALNGHMRLHGGFNDKQATSPSSTENIPKKKRLTQSISNEHRPIKRKRPSSPSTSNDSNVSSLFPSTMPIKNEEEDIIVMPSTSNTTNNIYQQTIYPTLPPCSDVLHHRSYDRIPSSRTRSISSSVIQHETTPLIQYNIKNPMSVQPITNISKQNRKQIPLPLYLYDKNNNHHYGFDIRTNDESIHNRTHIPNSTNNSLNIPSGILRFDHFTNPDMFSNVTTLQNHDDKFRKTLSADETFKYYHHDRQINGLIQPNHPQHHPYFRPTTTQHHPGNFSQFSIPPHSTSTIAPNIFHQILCHTNDLFNKDIYLPRTEHVSQHHSTSDEPNRYTPSTSPYTAQLYHSPSPRIVHSPSDKILNPTSSLINTPVTSPYSNINTSRCSPSSSNDMCNNNNNNTNNNMNNSSIINSRQSSPLTNSTQSHAVLKKRILNALKQEAQDEQQNNQIIPDCSPFMEQNNDQDKQQINIENSSEGPTSSLILKTNSDTNNTTVDKTTKKSTSGFLIISPSSSSTVTNSSTSTSSTNTHFNYENLSSTIPSKTSDTVTTTTNNNTNNSTTSSFQWPSQVSQFRRLQNLNMGSQTPNPLPTTPYTPPPMLSPFRKGPGLYYHVFSQTTPAVQQTSTVSTPVLPFTPIPDEISGPKINIGKDYQAIIPNLEMKIDNDDTDHDELLFSPSQLSYLDEQSLEKYEQLSRTNPLLFSPRHSPTLYPRELVYMLLHEYNGDLQRTLAALLDGTAQDIKQCRPLQRYHFPECDIWTKEEIDAFTKAMETSEKNFLLVSRAVGTKSIKQCIEFHYMPKVNLMGRETGMNLLTAKRKRLQMLKNKQQLQKQTYDDETSLSLNEFRLDDDGIMVNSDNSSIAQFSCDIDDCLQTFTSERAYRAHRNDHRRIKNNITPSTNTKRSRNLDLNK
ncbi:unnamed protein product [Rotaria sp. Silwood1]|nr:unnamed protein product [Rotaria sp. Silwood1]CAF4739345.1 unnamed protein product [Rotaria sp. Silwood1]